MAIEARLTVESGPCKGQRFVIEEGGSARAGRSSGNEIALADPAASRFHCRFFFKPGKGLWIADLGSSNQTLLNGRPVQEVRLSPGDRIEMGDSVIAVTSDGSGAVETPPAPPVPPATEAASVPQTPPGGVVDLGLSPTGERTKGSRPNIRLMLLLLALIAMSVLVLWIFCFWRPAHKKPAVARTELTPENCELRYERVDGSASNIFQSVLVIQGTRAGVEFHDVADRKHFQTPLTEVDQKVIHALWEAIRKTGVLSLTGIEHQESSQNSYSLRDLSVLMGTTSSRVRILNAPEPIEFENTRKILEGFGVNEFHMRSWPRPRGELERLANEGMQLGLKLYDEKNVSHENLFKALRALEEAVADLETVDPKPDFFNDLLRTRDTCKKELSTIVSDLWFQADRARKIRDWQEAVNVLKILCDTVPDRTHKDWKDADAQLTDAERRLKK